MLDCHRVQLYDDLVSLCSYDNLVALLAGHAAQDFTQVHSMLTAKQWNH